MNVSVCLSDCVSVLTCISGTTCPNSTPPEDDRATAVGNTNNKCQLSLMNPRDGNRAVDGA